MKEQMQQVRQGSPIHGLQQRETTDALGSVKRAEQRHRAISLKQSSGLQRRLPWNKSDLEIPGPFVRFVPLFISFCSEDLSRTISLANIVTDRS